MKMLVNNPLGLQELIEIGDGGFYFDNSLVVWDERIDGALPDITLGGMVRVADSLIFNKELFDGQPVTVEIAPGFKPDPTKQELLDEIRILMAKIEALK